MAETNSSTLLADDAAWQPIACAPEQTVEREFGPLSLRVSREEGQWWIERVHTGRNYPHRAMPQDGLDRVRFVVGEDETDALVPRPALADRAIVARPEVPLTVVGRSSARLLVSTPLWVALETRAGQRAAIIPTVVLKETWFGADTRNGDLCFASRTAARLWTDPAAGRSPFRVRTTIRVDNRSAKPFDVTRVRIPMPALDLYRTADGWFETPDIRVVRDIDGTDSATTLPAWDDTAVKLADPRPGSAAGFLGSLGRLLG